MDLDSEVKNSQTLMDALCAVMLFQPEFVVLRIEMTAPMGSTISGEMYIAAGNRIIWAKVLSPTTAEGLAAITALKHRGPAKFGVEAADPRTLTAAASFELPVKDLIQDIGKQAAAEYQSSGSYPTLQQNGPPSGENPGFKQTQEMPFKKTQELSPKVFAATMTAVPSETTRRLTEEAKQAAEQIEATLTADTKLAKDVAKKRLERRVRRRYLTIVASAAAVIISGGISYFIVQPGTQLKATADDMESVRDFVVASAESQASVPIPHSAHRVMLVARHAVPGAPGASYSSSPSGVSSRATTSGAGDDVTESIAPGQISASVEAKPGDHTGGPLQPNVPKGMWLKTKPGHPLIWKADPIK